MAATAIQEKTHQANPANALEKVTWKEFEANYLTREDEFKYEWVNGIIEKTTRSTDQMQIFILRNLRRFFEKLRAEGKVSGELEAEIDTKFSKDVMRRPDILWFSEEQLDKMAYGEKQIPEFVIEVISTNDQVNRLQEKMRNYRDADVKVVWQIFPNLEEVHVYKGTKMEICANEKKCSAAPVLPDFELKASEIFKKPPKPKDLK